jgi:hypothetical protein
MACDGQWVVMLVALSAIRCYDLVCMVWQYSFGGVVCVLGDCTRCCVVGCAVTSGCAAWRIEGRRAGRVGSCDCWRLNVLCCVGRSDLELVVAEHAVGGSCLALVVLLR